MADVVTGRNQNFDLGFMKINYYLMLGVMVTATAVAQSTNGPLPALPPPAPTDTIVPSAPSTP